MQTTLWLSAVLAMGAAAAPLEERAIKVVEVIDTVTVTLQPGQHAPTPAPEPVPAAVPAPAAQPAPAPAPDNGGGFLQNGGSAPTTGGQDAGASDFLSVANKWRARYGLPLFHHNPALDANVQEVGQNGGGVQEIHKLIPNMDMGQVITPGQHTNVGDTHGYSPFEMAYLAWLCEVPSDPQLQPEANGGEDPCDIVHSVLNMQYSETGHHDILVDEHYTGFSCAYTANPAVSQETAPYQGLYVCDTSA